MCGTQSWVKDPNVSLRRRIHSKNNENQSPPKAVWFDVVLLLCVAAHDLLL